MSWWKCRRRRPKPMPPLPVLHGVMYLGESPTAILSGGKASPQQVGVRPGETFGDFKLVDVSNDEIALEWDGQVINKKVDEMMVQSAPATVEDSRPAARTAAPASAAKSAPASTARRGSARRRYRRWLARLPARRHRPGRNGRRKYAQGCDAIALRRKLPLGAPEVSRHRDKK